MIALAAFAAASFAQAAGAPATTPAAAPPVVAPVLEKEKGARALEAYRKFRRQLCVELRSKKGPSERTSARLKEVGLEGAEPESLCIPGKVGTALASGALLDGGGEGVLLQVSTLLSAQTGQSLALMRDDGTGYRFIKHLLDAARFEARLRLLAPGRPDILLLCEYSGLGGVYPGACGFFGRGAFSERTTEPGAKDDLALIEVSEPCGPFESVNPGKIAAEGDRLVIELVLEKGVSVPGRGDVEGDCSKRAKKTRRSFNIEYKFDGQNFRRVTPTPKAVQAVLEKRLALVDGRLARTSRAPTARGQG